MDRTADERLPYEDEETVTELRTAAERAAEVLPEPYGPLIRGMLRWAARDVAKHGYLTAPVGMCLSITGLVDELNGTGRTPIR